MFDVVNLFSNFGILGLSLVLTLETGFLPLFFLPGDTLLFTAGYLVHAGNLSMSYAFITLGIGAFLGNMIGYFMGVFAEKPLMHFAKDEGSTFNKGLNRTREFYKKYGLLTLVFARFIPSVRTIAPFLAGVLRMPLHTFAAVSFFSGFFWVAVGLALGNIFGKKIPNLESVMVIVVIIAVSFGVVPVIFSLIKKAFKRNK